MDDTEEQDLTFDVEASRQLPAKQAASLDPSEVPTEDEFYGTRSEGLYANATADEDYGYDPAEAMMSSSVMPPGTEDYGDEGGGGDGGGGGGDGGGGGGGGGDSGGGGGGGGDSSGGGGGEASSATTSTDTAPRLSDKMRVSDKIRDMLRKPGTFAALKAAMSEGGLPPPGDFQTQARTSSASVSRAATFAPVSRAATSAPVSRAATFAPVSRAATSRAATSRAATSRFKTKLGASMDDFDCLGADEVGFDFGGLTNLLSAGAQYGMTEYEKSQKEKKTKAEREASEREVLEADRNAAMAVARAKVSEQAKTPSLEVDQLAAQTAVAAQDRAGMNLDPETSKKRSREAEKALAEAIKNAQAAPKDAYRAALVAAWTATVNKAQSMSIMLAPSKTGLPPQFTPAPEEKSWFMRPVVGPVPGWGVAAGGVGLLAVLGIVVKRFMAR